MYVFPTAFTGEVTTSETHVDTSEAMRIGKAGFSWEVRVRELKVITPTVTITTTTKTTRRRDVSNFFIAQDPFLTTSTKVTR
ncbi:hypothetical protein WVIC16_80027 [Weissella viridescens]|nr:hypothetical protein WVIC16_80027 [Weissella viridescens]